MYSFPNLEPVHCSVSGSNCCFLTCVQISQEEGKVVWYSHHFKNFPQFVVIHTVKGFNVVNEAEVFLEFFFFLYDPMDVGNLISGSSAFSKSSLSICRFSVHVLLKPSLENFEHYFTSVWDECNCAVVWAFFGITEEDLEWAFRTEVVILRNQHGLTASSLCQSNKFVSLTTLGREMGEIPVRRSIWTLSRPLIRFLW